MKVYESIKKLESAIISGIYVPVYELETEIYEQVFTCSKSAIKAREKKV